MFEMDPSSLMSGEGETTDGLLGPGQAPFLDSTRFQTLEYGGSAREYAMTETLRACEGQCMGRALARIQMRYSFAWAKAPAPTV
jgi:hypothetical protein